ncbi:cytochrome P450 [Syncephalastrum racemosum]|uniref:Cytochrome P450 n=1 Tax=Syncephalastrum racemosum TaxID=13706 RepID=A0A1X2HL87_SYNRA|nr:cytochrome P450 [Syncephalastrum racemosum]
MEGQRSGTEIQVKISYPPCKSYLFHLLAEEKAGKKPLDRIAVTLSWTLAELVHHPEVQQKIQEEVDVFITKHGRHPTFAERDQFPYLISVQKECLRCHPPSPFGAPHTATEDLNFRGHFIKKGTVLVANLHAMHLGPEAYPDEPTRFKPDRFMQNIVPMAAAANTKIESRDIYVFGWGRRICPGIYLAESEVFAIMTRIFASCDILPVIDQKTKKPIYPVLDKARDSGLVMLPLEYNVRFVKRGQ